MDSVQQEDNSIELFFETIKSLFGKNLVNFTMNENFNPVVMFGMKGDPVAEFYGGRNSTIELKFAGTFEDMLEIRKFMTGLAHNISIHEGVDAIGQNLVVADFVLSGATIKNNRKLYDAQFDKLIEEELSQKPTK